jgi:signal transduction histidine kinase
MAHVSFGKPFKSLRFQLVGLILLPLTALGSLVVWATYEKLEDLIEQRLENEIELAARAVRVPVEEALQAGDLERVQSTLDAVFDIGRVYGAYVYGEDGERIAAAGEARPSRREQAEAARLARQGRETGRYAELAGKPVFSYFVPLSGITGRIEGLLQVVRLESDITDRLAALRTAGWIAWGVVMLVMLAIVLVGHRLAVGRHVERLEGSMARIESGERSHRAAVVGPAEIAGVAAALNRMLDGLDRMTEELAEQRRARRRMERRMLAQENLARLGRFSSGVAHELSAPLTVIDGDARRLQRSPSLSDDAARRLTRMRRQVERTRELIGQLMEFARSEQDEPRRVELDRLLQRVIGAVRPECESAGIALDVELPDEPPAVEGWAVRLEHAVLNLVRNALQAARARVVVAMIVDDGVVSIVVEDDGPGIPERERRTIFEPFHTARKGRHGTGLGLAIVDAVVEEHGASIEVGRSRWGGSRFELRLKEAADE